MNSTPREESDLEEMRRNTALHNELILLFPLLRSFDSDWRYEKGKKYSNAPRGFAPKVSQNADRQAQDLLGKV
jgi:hypothetical protein